MFENNFKKINKLHIRTRIVFFIKTITNSVLLWMHPTEYTYWYDWNSFMFVNASLNYLGKPSGVMVPTEFP